MIKNLFLLKNKKISVFRYKDELIEAIKKEGEIFFDIEKDFWSWWKEAVDYVENDELDFCFISDIKDEFIFDSEFFIKPLQNSVWNIYIINKILNDLNIKKYKLLSYEEENKEKLENVFYTNEIFLSKKSKIKLNTNLKCETPAQKYFRKKIEKEKAQRRKK